MRPSGDRLIHYIAAVREAARRAYPGQVLLSDAWHMGWIARRIGRPLSDAPAFAESTLRAWQAGWAAAGGTWDEVGQRIMPAREPATEGTR